MTKSGKRILESLIDTIRLFPETSFILSPDLNYLVVNEAFINYYSILLQPGDFTGQLFHPLLKKEESDKIHILFRQMEETGKSLTVEYKIDSTNHNIRSLKLSASPLKDDDKQLIGFFCMESDRTEFKLIEDTSIRQFEELLKFRLMVERSNSTIIISDLEMNIFFINRAGLQLFRLQNTMKALNFSLNSFFREKTVITMNKVLYGLKEKEFWSGDLSLEIIRGDTVHVLAQVVKLDDLEERTIGYAFIFDDITALKESEKENRRINEQLNNLNRELEQRVKKRTLELEQSIETIKSTQEQLIETEKMASLGSLVTGIAHEINTPLGIGVTAASYLREITGELLRNPTEAGLKEYMHNAEKSSEMILKTLQRAAVLIKSFKQIAVDQINEDKRIFNLNQYLNNICLSMSPELTRHNIKIEITGPLDFELDSYPGFFSQIFTNLIKNSIVHGYEDYSNGHIHIKYSRKGDSLHMIYYDDGRGITESKVKKIFDPFFTTKRGSGGSGLGLHIVYNVVTIRFNGRIKCESEIGKYTRFIMDIPLNPSVKP